MTDELGGGSYAWALQVAVAVGAAGTIAGAADALYDAVTGNTESTARSGETLTGGISWDVEQADSAAAAEQSGSSVGDTWVQGTSRYVVVGEEADSRVGLIFTQVQSSLEDAAVDAVSAAQAAVSTDLAVDAVSAAQAASTAVQTVAAAEQSTASGAGSGSAAVSAASAVSGVSASASDSARTAAEAAGSSGSGSSAGSAGSTGSSAAAAAEDPLGVRTVRNRTGGTGPVESAILAYEQNSASALPAGASPWAGDYAPLAETQETALWEGASGILTERLSASGAEAETGVLWGTGADVRELWSSVGAEEIRTQPGAVAAAGTGAAESGTTAAESAMPEPEEPQTVADFVADSAADSAAETVAESTDAAAAAEQSVLTAEFYGALLQAADAGVREQGAEELTRLVRERRCDEACENSGMNPHAGIELAESASTKWSVVSGQSGGAAEDFGPLWDENGASASTKAEAEAAAVVAPLSGPAAWTAAEASGLLRDLAPERESTLADAAALRQMAAGAAPVLPAGSARSRNRSGDGGGTAAPQAGLTMQEILSGIAEDFAARLAVSAAGVHRP